MPPPGTGEHLGEVQALRLQAVSPGLGLEVAAAVVGQGLQALARLVDKAAYLAPLVGGELPQALVQRGQLRTLAQHLRLGRAQLLGIGSGLEPGRTLLFDPDDVLGVHVPGVHVLDVHA